MNDEDITNSSRAVEEQTGISQETVKKALKMHPYKTEVLLKLHDHDFDRRMEFCVFMGREVVENLCIRTTTQASALRLIKDKKREFGL